MLKDIGAALQDPKNQLPASAALVGLQEDQSSIHLYHFIGQGLIMGPWQME
jgi:hypothetical protein